MPYKIAKKGSKYVVVNKKSGKVMGSHDTKSAAERQRRAIYANEKKK